MNRLTTPIRPHPATLLRGTAAALALGCLLAGALPAAAQKESDRRTAPDRQERQMIVISTDDAKVQPRIATRLLGGGFLGVELTALTPELRAHFGVPADRGVMVSRVQEDSPAARAGLRVGDIVTGIDGDAIESPWDLAGAVRGHGTGEDADLVVWRDGRSLDFRVKIEERSRERIDLGRVFEFQNGDGPDVLRWKQQGGPGDAATLYFQPEMVERLRESLDKIDWPLLNQKLLTDRNRELEERLEGLEKRLKELEEALKHSNR